MATLGRRQLLHGSLAPAALAITTRLAAAQIPDTARVAMARAAGAFVAALAPPASPSTI